MAIFEVNRLNFDKWLFIVLFAENKTRTMKNFNYPLLAGLLLLACSCQAEDPAALSGGSPADDGTRMISAGSFTLKDMAVILSSLPIGEEQMAEVHGAVSSSSGNGYDEEYMMRDLISSPGAGVGDDAATRTRAAGNYSRPLRSLLEDYLAEKLTTRAGSGGVQEALSALQDSEMQIYWPYSEDWDGVTLPIVTFDPGYGTERNVGYVVGSGGAVVDSVLVDEYLAQERPVWVINRNDDSAFTPMEMYASTRAEASTEQDKTLYMKDFTMLRNYDSWFAGGSEFFIKCGAATGFKPSNDEDIKKYSPNLTDLMVVVKRSQVGQKIPYDAVLVSGFTENLDKLAFLITEDDGGPRTSWKCEASVKYKSKTYGFDLEIPLNEKDDIVWRGQLSASYYIGKNDVTGRFGDVRITFRLE